MMAAALHAFADGAERGRALAAALGLPFAPVSLHRFPDGESLVQVDPEYAQGCALFYRSLDDPNAKLVELLLAAAALRANGAQRVVLVAPYLAYMRQDMAFAAGQAISQQVIGALLAGHFDALLTVDPHLHRIASLAEVMPGIAAHSISAAGVLAADLDPAEAPVLVGPDAESRQWVEAIAAPLGLSAIVGTKQRHGDRDVSIAFDAPDLVRGRKAVLVDDVISSGTTLARAAEGLLAAGARCVEVLATHCLAHADDLARMKAAGISRIRATDSVPGPCAVLPLAGLLADAIRHQNLIEGARP